MLVISDVHCWVGDRWLVLTRVASKNLHGTCHCELQFPVSANFCCSFMSYLLNSYFTLLRKQHRKQKARLTGCKANYPQYLQNRPWVGILKFGGLVSWRAVAWELGDLNSGLALPLTMWHRATLLFSLIFSVPFSETKGEKRSIQPFLAFASYDRIYFLECYSDIQHQK